MMTHCHRGHEKTSENTRTDKRGEHCRLCERLRYQRHEGRKRTKQFLKGDTVSVLTPEMKRDGFPRETGEIDKLIRYKASYIYRVSCNGHHRYGSSASLLRVCVAKKHLDKLPLT